MLLAHYRHVKRTSRYATRESHYGLEFSPRLDAVNWNSVSCWWTNLRVQRLGPTVKSFLSTEILQVRLHAQKDTLDVSQHSERRGRGEPDPG
jgi:hypothetical protein